MIKKINKAIIQHLGKDSLIKEILGLLNKEKSQLLELVGESGTGKSFIYKKLIQTFENEKREFIAFNPSLFEVNQFKRLIQKMINIEEEKLDEFLLINDTPNLTGKYDFFYYFTESFKEKFQPKTILIDNCDMMDQYTIDFIQFFHEYSSDLKTDFITFTSKELFTFSSKIKISFFEKEVIRNILHELFLAEKDYLTESEILFNITKGNVFILEEVLNNIFSSQGLQEGKDLNLDNYIERSYSVIDIYRTRIENINSTQLQLMIYIYLLDDMAEIGILEENFAFKSLKKDIIFLQQQGLIDIEEEQIRIKKKQNFQNFFNNLAEKEQSKYLQKILTLCDELKVSETKIAAYKLKVPNSSFSEHLIDYLYRICDFSVLYSIFKEILVGEKRLKDRIEILKKLGKICMNLQKMDEALEHFRNALKLTASKKLAAEEIVYLLAKTHFSINSSTFAFEIIKKFTPDYIDKYWLAKLILLKAEILVDLSNLDEAKNCLEEVYEVYNHIENEIDSKKVMAEAKKQRGKICYYMNQWDKAESSFKEAEKYYLMCNDKEGLAAIYNNIGVLKMFQGELKETEKLYQKSLNLERERYSLSGISVCYNNLGGLWEDIGDYKKSLYFLQEALKIQRMLADRYNTCNLYNNIGVTYMNNGEYVKASEAFNKTLEISLNFNLYRNIVAVYNNLGALNLKTGKWGEAVKYYELAVKKSEEYKFWDGLCKSYNNIGELYEKKGEYNIACDFYFKALELLAEISDAYLKAEVWGNMGSILTQIHKFSEAYGYLVESLDFFKNLNAQDKIIEGNLKLAYYFIMTRNYESSDYYLYQSLKKANEINNRFLLGQVFYYRSLLERKNKDLAIDFLEKAKKCFVETNNIFELAKVNYELASILEESGKWEQALNILNSNNKTLKQFGQLSLIEMNDMLIQKIQNEYVNEINESKNHTFLLNKFSEATQKLKSVNDFDVLLKESLESLMGLSDADGGIFALYNTASNPESWEYKLFSNFSYDEDDYDVIMEIFQKSFTENKTISDKQPSYAPEYNHIITVPLNFQNETIGVLLLFTKHGVSYFNENVVNLVNALCNQIVVIIENLRYKNLTKSHAIIREEINAANIFTNIIGKSEKIRKIFDLIDKIKDAPTTVLLEGQSGTGKELIARAIHFTSNRKNKKFVAQYCGSLPETLLESELFGHVKGAFTGATYDKKGLFEIADGGTFFLDEIADISLSTQAKLLRFLQEGEIKRVGSTKTQNVNVRVICATNTSLSEKVEKGEFRLDLYYRLNVIKIDMPSLKERKSDIPLLAIHFLDKYNKKIGKEIKGITDEAMKYLIKCDWPGNIRQLENEIERAVTLLEDSSFIRPSDLSEEIFRYRENTETMDLLERSTLKEAVDKLEKDMILNTLDKFGWNQTQTAKELGLSRQGLIKKIKRYDLQKK